MKFVSGVIAASLLAISACSPVEKSPEVSRTLNDTRGLTLRSNQLPTLVYARDGVPDLSAYNRFIVDTVSVSYADSDIRELTQEEIERMRSYFRDAVVKELQEGGYVVGTRSEPGTMRISLAISGLSASQTGGLKNAAGIVASSALGVPGVFSISVGEVTIEAGFREAITNRVDAVVVSRTQGSRFLNDSPWSTWSDVEGSFDEWAEDFREAVDEAHGKG